MKKLLLIALVFLASCGQVRHTGAPYYSNKVSYAPRIKEFNPLRKNGTERYFFQRKPMSQRSKYIRRMNKWCGNPAYNNHENY